MIINFMKFLFFMLLTMILFLSLAALFDGKILGGVIAGFIFGGMYYYNHLQRKRLFTTVKAIDNEKRKLVIYLRSFQEESNNSILEKLKESFFGEFIPGVSNPIREQEQHSFAKYMNQIGVYVAIGRPGESLPYPGAKKVYVTDDEWQNVVSRWIDKSVAVVLEPGGSGEGLSWEISHIVNYAKPEKILVILPRIHSEYEPVRKYLNKLFPKPLPEKVNRDIRLITFKSDWEPFPIKYLFLFFRQNGLDDPKDIDPYF